MFTSRSEGDNEEMTQRSNEYLQTPLNRCVCLCVFVGKMFPQTMRTTIHLSSSPSLQKGMQVNSLVTRSVPCPYCPSTSLLRLTRPYDLKGPGDPESLLQRVSLRTDPVSWIDCTLAKGRRVYMKQTRKKETRKDVKESVLKQ